jgi:hypothetical protein
MFRLLAIFLLTPLSFLSQEICGFVPEDNDFDTQLFSGNVSSGKVVKTVCHVFYSEDHPGSFILSSDVDSAFSSLNFWFEGSNISFDLLAVQYHNIDSTIIDNYGCVPYSFAATDQYASVCWDRERYMNVYVVPEMCSSVLGFAYLSPTYSHAGDGAWVRSDAFGFSNPEMLPEHNLNKTLVHEVGHYCGLYHVFTYTDVCNQGVSSPCNQIQDRVCDTAPVTVSWSCEELSCTNTDFWEGYPWENYENNNHMDYYPDACRVNFTAGQISRMNAWLSVIRGSLFEDYSCDCDFNDDGVVGTADLLIWVSNFGEVSDEGDADGNGFVDSSDLQLLLSEYGDECE